MKSLGEGFDCVLGTALPEADQTQAEMCFGQLRFILDAGLESVCRGIELSGLQGLGSFLAILRLADRPRLKAECEHDDFGREQEERAKRLPSWAHPARSGGLGFLSRGTQWHPVRE